MIKSGSVWEAEDSLFVKRALDSLVSVDAYLAILHLTTSTIDNLFLSIYNI